MPGKILELMDLGELLPAEDHPAARAAQGLVGGGRHEVGMGDRARVKSCRHQPGNVGHVDHHLGTHLVGNGPEGGKSMMRG